MAHKYAAFCMFDPIRPF